MPQHSPPSGCCGLTERPTHNDMLSTSTFAKSGVPACEPEAFYGSNLAATLCGLNNTLVTKKLGPPDALLRRGVLDCGLWRVERVTSYSGNRKWTPGASKPVVYYSWPEACRYVGVDRLVLKRILGGTKAPAIQVGQNLEYDLWAESFLYLIRKAIAEGRIYVHARSLRKPRMGVSICSPRHTAAADQNAEGEAYRKANPYAGVRW
jgi:hypothetical protein